MKDRLDLHLLLILRLDHKSNIPEIPPSKHQLSRAVILLVLLLCEALSAHVLTEGVKQTQEKPNVS
jgi:hypothetical protein